MVRDSYMNESKAPKLEAKKIVSDISALYGENEDVPVTISPPSAGKSGLRKLVWAIYRIPVVGYLLKIVVRIIMLPKTTQRLIDDITRLHRQNDWLLEHIHRTNIRLDEQNDKMLMCFDALKSRIENPNDADPGCDDTVNLESNE